VLVHLPQPQLSEIATVEKHLPSTLFRHRRRRRRRRRCTTTTTTTTPQQHLLLFSYLAVPVVAHSRAHRPAHSRAHRCDGVVEAHEQVHDRGLAPPAPPHERHDLPRVHDQTHPAQHPALGTRPVVEAHVTQLDVEGGTEQRHGRGYRGLTGRWVDVDCWLLAVHLRLHICLAVVRG
jgi:hypothetical protein